MASEEYQVVILVLMILLCVSSYCRGYWKGRAFDGSAGWRDEALFWRERQRDHDDKYVSVMRSKE